MKISAKQYAQGLYELVYKKKEDEAREVLVSFVKYLGANNDIYKIDDVIKYFNEILQKERGQLNVSLVSARKLSADVSLLVINYLKNKVGAKEVEIESTINPDILGGFILRYDDKVIDGSLKQNLLNFQKQISN